MSGQLIGVQRRMMELGRIRLGDKDDRGNPRKGETFRLTSASQQLLEAAAQVYGGTARKWEGSPDEGYFELYTTSTQLNVVIPPAFNQRDGSPTAPYSQYFELWSGGGCQRRCDGETELMTGKPCMCDPDNRDCKITTRAQFILPELPGLGVWRLETHGYNAAAELPGTLELLRMAAEGNTFIRAVLRIEHRTKRVAGEKYPRRFLVPVVDLPDTRIGEIAAAAGTPLSIGAPSPPPVRPELPAAPAPPADPVTVEEAHTPAHGPAPSLPSSPSGDVVADRGTYTRLAEERGLTNNGQDKPPASGEVKVISDAQWKRLWAIARNHGVPDPEVKRLTLEVTKQEHTRQIPKGVLYDAVIAALEAWAPA